MGQPVRIYLGHLPMIYPARGSVPVGGVFLYRNYVIDL